LQEQKKKRKKKIQEQIEVVDEQISESGQDLVDALEELEHEKKYLDVPICPKCKSPKIKRTDTQSGDLFGHMGITPPKYECKECGWTTQVVLKATNKPLTVKEVEHILEANEETEK
jgi:ribosomal protein L37AE/L43A